MTGQNGSRDRWDKIDILLKPVGGLLTGLALAGVGYFTKEALENQQAEETNRRVYAQIMSSREKSDSDLRKEMFNAIIKAFLDPKEAKLKDKVLALELLAYNFHDVIDLSPLFKHVALAVAASPDEADHLLKGQLERVAREVIDKQLAALSDVGDLQYISLDFDAFRNSDELPGVERMLPVRSGLHGNEPLQRYIRLEVLHVREKSREVKVMLQSGLQKGTGEIDQPEVDIVFDVGFFDFPMIDNTRVSNGQRIAVALTDWSDYGAQLALIYFPGSRASLKEKPYYDEVIEQLKRAHAAAGGSDHDGG